MPDEEDPFQPLVPTRLRPRPGHGRAGATRTATPDPLLRGPAARGRAISAAAPESLGASLNPVVQAATSLLLLSGQLRGTVSTPDIGSVRADTLEQISQFEERASTLGVVQSVVMAARYAICAAIDEAVLSTPWGAESNWSRQTLLVELHNDTRGGEKFFEVLEGIAGNPTRFIELMELYYLCLAFGFAGKYESAEREHTRLTEIRRQLARAISQHRGTQTAELSPRWRGREDRQNPVVRYAPWWVVGAAVLAILGTTFAFFHLRLNRFAAPVHAQLADVGTEDFTGPPVAVAMTGPTLETLLTSEAERGTLLVETEGGRTRITLLAEDLFASGRAVVNPVYDDTLRQVAAVLDRVPGRVLVEGHTDDQPMRSLRFQNNHALSSERAAQVESLLAAQMTDPGRVTSRGLGSSQPRFLPEAENRSRNRRVEILHVRQ